MSTSETTITDDEIALYDRQIRLWGLNAQEKIRRAHVLLVTLKALGTEVAKNLVLAGIASLTIADPGRITAADLETQFFLAAVDRPALVGESRAKAAKANVERLNPRVRVSIETSAHSSGSETQAPESDINTDTDTTNTHSHSTSHSTTTTTTPQDHILRHKPPSYFGQFDVIIATDLDPLTLRHINDATRAVNKPFYAAASYGPYGFLFADLIEHVYDITREAPNPLQATPPGPETATRSILRSVLLSDASAAKDARPQERVTKREVYTPWQTVSETAALPESLRTSKRRLRNVTPLLSCLRALWSFEVTHQRRPSKTQRTTAADSSTARHDLEAFTRLATRAHAQLGLPAETLRPETIRAFLQSCSLSASDADSDAAADDVCELAPVAAILGGQLAQDVINVLGQNQQPIQNLVVFDGQRMEAPMYALGSAEDHRL